LFKLAEHVSFVGGDEVGQRLHLVALGIAIPQLEEIFVGIL